MPETKKVVCRNPQCQYEQPFSDAQFCERCGTRLKNICFAKVLNEKGFEQVCRTHNSEDARFCRICGTSLATNFPKDFFEQTPT